MWIIKDLYIRSNREGNGFNTEYMQNAADEGLEQPTIAFIPQNFLSSACDDDQGNE